VRKKRANESAPTPQMIVERIARKALFIPTLKTRNSDSLDFHEVAVWTVQRALLAAFAAGRTYVPRTPAGPAISRFTESMEEMRVRAQAKIRELAAEMDKGQQQLAWLYWEHITRLRKHLRKCANREKGASRAERAMAIARCEAWVSETICNRGAKCWVVSVLALRGEEAGEKWIRRGLARRVAG